MKISRLGGEIINCSDVIRFRSFTVVVVEVERGPACLAGRKGGEDLGDLLEKRGLRMVGLSEQLNRSALQCSPRLSL